MPFSLYMKHVMLKDRIMFGPQPFVFVPLKKLSSPYINRFLSADTIVPNPANPQSFNRYSYVMNNPLRYIDPTGHSGCELYQGVCLSENQMTEIYNDTTGNGNNNNHDDDDEDEDEGIMDYCSTHPGACGLPPAPDPTPSIIPDPLPADGVTNDADYCVRHPYACNASPPTPLANDSTTRIVELAAGSVLVVGGLLVTALGGLIAVTALIEIGGLSTIAPPLIIPTTLHAGPAVVIGGAMALVGVGITVVGGYLIYDSLTP